MNRLAVVRRGLWPVLFLAALAPAPWLAWRAFAGDGLGADPVKTLQTSTGLTAIILLLTTLAITPVRRLSGWNELIRLRRMLGLWSFAWVVVHLLVYLVFDQSLDLGSIAADTVEHPRIAVGAAAFLMLLPLAVTSTDGMIRRLGRRWGRLHRLIYPATALGILHYLMVQKLDWRVGAVYVVMLVLLLALRLVPAGWRRRAAVG